MVIIMTLTKRLRTLGQIICVPLFLSNFAHAGALDPLSSEEIEKAKQIQLSYVRDHHPSFLATTNPETDTSLAENIEILLIERHAVKKGEERSAPRLVDLYSYDYKVNTLNQVLINLNTNSVVSLKQDTEVQLPLTQNEIDKAVAILLANQEQYKLILNEFKQITGEEYTSTDQIEIKAFAFWGNTLLGVSNGESLKCGKHRCAQILIYTPDLVAFEVSPIVDLSIKKVVQNINF
jgi:hypothetical protein